MWTYLILKLSTSNRVELCCIIVEASTAILYYIVTYSVQQELYSLYISFTVTLQMVAMKFRHTLEGRFMHNLGCLELFSIIEHYLLSMVAMNVLYS